MVSTFILRWTSITRSETKGVLASIRKLKEFQIKDILQVIFYICFIYHARTAVFKDYFGNHDGFDKWPDNYTVMQRNAGNF